MTIRAIVLPLPLALAACAPQIADSSDLTDSTGSESQGSTGMSSTTDSSGPAIELDAPCDFGIEDADELALVTNDFVAPPGLARVDVAGRQIAPDLLPATTDTALGARGDWLVMVHRYGQNRVDLVDRKADWALVGSADVRHEGVDDPNPQGVAFDGDGLAYVPLFAAPAVQIFDFSRAPADWLAGSIDLSAFADADGSPEAGAALACGRVLFVGIQRLENFVPVDQSYLVPIDLDARAAIDLDPAAAGTQAIPLLGPWPKQFRRDPADATWHTALVLTSGIERVNLSYGTSEWAVAPEVLAAAGVDGFDVQAFALAADGASVYLAATDGDFPGSAVFHVGLDGGAPATPVKLIEGLVSGDRMLERLGTTLWVGDANPETPRLRAWDLAGAAPQEIAAEGLATAVPPWTFIPLP